MTALRECRTCEWLLIRNPPGERRVEMLCMCLTPSVNVRAGQAVKLTDWCVGWAERPDPFEPEE